MLCLGMHQLSARHSCGIMPPVCTCWPTVQHLHDGGPVSMSLPAGSTWLGGCWSQLISCQAFALWVPLI